MSEQRLHVKITMAKPEVDDFIKKHMGEDFGMAKFDQRVEVQQKRAWSSQCVKRQYVKRTGFRRELVKQESIKGEGGTMLSASAAVCQSTEKTSASSVIRLKEFQAAW